MLHVMKVKLGPSQPSLAWLGWVENNMDTSGWLHLSWNISVIGVFCAGRLLSCDPWPVPVPCCAVALHYRCWEEWGEEEQDGFIKSWAGWVKRRVRSGSVVLRSPAPLQCTDWLGQWVAAISRLFTGPRTAGLLVELPVATVGSVRQEWEKRSCRSRGGGGGAVEWDWVEVITDSPGRG